MSKMSSLVPRSSHCPDFDHLQYVETGQIILSHEWCQCLPKVGRPLIKERILHMRSLFEPGAVHFALLERSKLQCLGQKLQDTDIIHMINWTRPSPSIFAYCKQSKLDSGRPGIKATKRIQWSCCKLEEHWYCSAVETSWDTIQSWLSCMPYIDLSLACNEVIELGTVPTFV